MSTLSPGALDELVASAARITGFSLEAILPDAVRRAARPLLEGRTEAELLALCRGDAPEVARALCQAVSVGETYFFRQPEHFRLVSQELLPALAVGGRRRVRAWSAGCATGEEAWSLAACLLDAGTPLGLTEPEVLGTDLLARNLAGARAGSYGAWSKRETAPILHPLLEPGQEKPPLRIREELRRVVRFAEHNLLQPPLEGSFDLVFCRNVLVYFAPEQARVALRNLAGALANGGVLVLGSMDVLEAPPGLVRVGSPEHQVWRRSPDAPAKAPARELAQRAVAPAVVRAPRKTPPPEPVAQHLRALLLVERGELARAGEVLEELVSAAPDYVPGLLERALLHARKGERAAAGARMREILRRTDALPLDAALAAPEPLPVRFFRESAEAWLRGARGRGA